MSNHLAAVLEYDEPLREVKLRYFGVISLRYREKEGRGPRWNCTEVFDGVPADIELRILASSMVC